MDNLESVYDEKITPLVKQIIEICKEVKMPMFMEFQYGNDDFCKSYLKSGHPVFVHLDAISQCKEKTGINIDKYMMWCSEGAYKNGHSSIYLKLAGVPEISKRAMEEK